MRYHGQEHTVEVAVAGNDALDRETLTAAFHERHRRRYTFALEDTAVEIVNIRVTATARVSRPVIGMAGGDGADPRKGTRMVHFADGAAGAAAPVATAIYDRQRLPSGFQATGPLIVEEPSTTTVVHPGQRIAVDALGNLVITIAPSPLTPPQSSSRFGCTAQGSVGVAMLTRPTELRTVGMPEELRHLGGSTAVRVPFHRRRRALAFVKRQAGVALVRGWT